MEEDNFIKWNFATEKTIKIDRGLLWKKTIL